MDDIYMQTVNALCDLASKNNVNTLKLIKRFSQLHITLCRKGEDLHAHQLSALLFEDECTPLNKLVYFASIPGRLLAMKFKLALIFKVQCKLELHAYEDSFQGTFPESEHNTLRAILEKYRIAIEQYKDDFLDDFVNKTLQYKELGVILKTTNSCFAGWLANIAGINASKNQFRNTTQDPSLVDKKMSSKADSQQIKDQEMDAKIAQIKVKPTKSRLAQRIEQRQDIIVRDDGEMVLRRVSKWRWEKFI